MTRIICWLFGHDLKDTGGFTLCSGWYKQRKCNRCSEYVYVPWEGPTEEQFDRWMNREWYL